jgi:2-phosphosulfolactate phosphatase
MPTLHVLFKKEDLDPDRLRDKVVIVLDVLFATSTIVHAFGQGITCMWPARDADEARRIAAQLDAPLLAGEYRSDSVPGFGPATPLALSECALHGSTLVYATTNGTVALSNAAGASHVYAGALLNGKALVSHVTRTHPDASILLMCSGTMDSFNLEDFYGAGHFTAHFERTGNYTLTDAALAALLMYRSCDAGTALRASRVGHMTTAHGLQHEVDCAAQLDTLDIVPELSNGCLRVVTS